MLRSLTEKFAAVQILAPQTLSADAQTAAFDLQRLSNAALMVMVGAFAFSGTNKIELEVLHSDDNVTYDPVASTELYALEGAPNVAKILDDPAEGNAIHVIGYRGDRRYIKPNLDVGGTVSVPIAVAGISTLPQLRPKP